MKAAVSEPDQYCPDANSNKSVFSHKALIVAFLNSHRFSYLISIMCGYPIIRLSRTPQISINIYGSIQYSTVFHSVGECGLMPQPASYIIPHGVCGLLHKIYCVHLSAKPGEQFGQEGWGHWWRAYLVVCGLFSFLEEHTHWGLNNMDTDLKMTHWNTLSWILFVYF